jgi:hypothetical protein
MSTGIRVCSRHDVGDRDPRAGAQDRRQLAGADRVVVGIDDEHFPEIGRQLVAVERR